LALIFNSRPCRHKLIVTEIQPDNADNDYYEFFEVYNATSQDIDLSEQAVQMSYYTSGSSVPVAYPDNTVIEAKTAVVFWLSDNDGSVDNTGLTEADFKHYYEISGTDTDTTTDNLDAQYDIVRVTGLNGLPDTGDFGIRISDSTGQVRSESYCTERTAKDRPYEFRLTDNGTVELLEDDVLPSPGKTVLKQNINTVYEESLASGIQYTEENISNFYDTGYDEHFNCVEIDLPNSDTYVLASKADDTVNAMETIGSQAEREIDRGYNVVAGINADMYDMTTGMPISIQIRENELIVSQSPYEEINAVRPALFIDSDHKAGIDRLSTEGTVTVGSYLSSINMFNRSQDVTDDIVIFTRDVSTDHTLTHVYGYEKAAFALIKMDHFEFEMTALSDYVRTTNSRTAIGVKADGTLVAVTVDKPSSGYSGSV
jgi:hypothetical protein